MRATLAAYGSALTGKLILTCIRKLMQIDYAQNSISIDVYEQQVHANMVLTNS